MMSLNREVVIAALSLAACGILGWSSFSIRDPGYGTLAPAAWPQMVLVVLAVLSAIHLFRSAMGGAGDAEAAPAGGSRSIGDFLAHYRNPLLCYAIYFVFLLTLPVLGALIGGILLVFLLLNILGGWSPRALMQHALIAVISMGAMWSLFTFGLRVILPEGVVFSVL